MPYKISVGSIVAAAALCVASGIGAQAQDVSKYPDWSGQWKRAMNPQVAFAGQWDPSKPAGRAQQAPLTPEYQARFEANLADQAAGGQGDNILGGDQTPASSEEHRVAMRLEGWNASVPGSILRDGRARARPPQDEGPLARRHWRIMRPRQCGHKLRRS